LRATLASAWPSALGNCAQTKQQQQDGTIRTDSLPDTLRRSLPADAPKSGTSKLGFCRYCCTSYGHGLTLVQTSVNPREKTRGLLGRGRYCLKWFAGTRLPRPSRRPAASRRQPVGKYQACCRPRQELSRHYEGWHDLQRHHGGPISTLAVQDNVRNRGPNGRDTDIAIRQRLRRVTCNFPAPQGECCGTLSQALPLIVMLHGGTQTPDDFAAGTRTNLVAEDWFCGSTRQKSTPALSLAGAESKVRQPLVQN
jgi:hypothetical protein